MKNKIEDLRNHLFEQLEKLNDDNIANIDREIRKSSAIVQVASSIIESGKLEMEYMKIAKVTVKVIEFFSKD